MKKSFVIKKSAFVIGITLLIMSLGACRNDRNSVIEQSGNAKQEQKQKIIGETNAKGLVEIIVKSKDSKITMGTNANNETVFVRDYSIGSDNKKHVFTDEDKGISSLLFAEKKEMNSSQEVALKDLLASMKDSDSQNLDQIWTQENSDGLTSRPDGAGADYLTISNAKIINEDNQAYISCDVIVHYHLANGTKKTKDYSSKVAMGESTSKISQYDLNLTKGDNVVYDQPLEYRYDIAN